MTYGTTPARILACVQRLHAVNGIDVARALGIAEQTAHKLLRELVKAGHIDLRANSRPKVYVARRSAASMTAHAAEPLTPPSETAERLTGVGVADASSEGTC